MQSLEMRSYTHIVDAASENQGRRVLLVEGFASGRTLGEAAKRLQRRLESETARRRLAQLNDEIDRLYDVVDGLRCRMDAVDAAEREVVARDIAARLDVLREKQSMAAEEMRRQLNASNVIQHLDQGLAAMKQAKELLSRGEGPADNDTAS